MKKLHLNSLCVLILFLTAFVGNLPSYAAPVVPDYRINENGIWTKDTSVPQFRKSPVSSRLSSDDTSALLMFTGDLMCLAGQQFSAERRSSFNFDSSFGYVEKLFNSADFVCGNLESLISSSNPLTKQQKNIGSAPQCNGPEEYLWALRKAGFDCLVTANNHCCDWGTSGISETEKMLDKYHFAHVGTSSSIESNYVLFDIKDFRIAILSTTHIINQRGKLNADEMYSMVSCYDKERVIHDIADARLNGADFVVVYCHWGTENTEELTSVQKDSALEVAEAGADLIIGSHPHCLQGKEILTTSDGRSVPVMYSMGNFVSSMARDINNDTIILNVRISRNSDDKSYIEAINYIPCHVMNSATYGNLCVVPTEPVFNNASASASLQAAEKRIRRIIGSFDFPFI